ncbi:MAG: DUF559 domain-containing protein [Alphaproteobacteria bacterium]|nr:DUF559 domain-containing protein [Alphaproteobacteria bacterium]
MSEAERVLWMLLRSRRFEGWKFRRQAPLGRYVVDFFCPAAALVVELDGAQQANAEQAAFDATRTAELQASGIRVMRIWVGDLFHDREGAMEAVWQALHRR